MELEKLWSEWKVDEFIGEGSFGKVYRIVREDFGHTYEAALKVIEIPQNQSEYKTIKSEGLSDESAQEYFKSVVEDIVNEFALMSKLKGNSNIVSYEDHSVIPKETEFGWEIFIRMELLTPLFNYLEEHELTVKDVIQLGIDMCKALEVCQKYNIIHRDIKPENIFVSDIGTFKLGDFGIARQLEKTTSGMSKKGTYTYMAPEVYKGLEYNSTVDIYSLGIVLYRFLNNNRAPFMPPAPQQIRYSDKEQANVMRLSGQPMSKPCNAEGRLAEIILKACAYDPKERYESPRVMRQELQALLYTEAEKKLVYPDGDVLINDRNDYVTSTHGLFFNREEKGEQKDSLNLNKEWRDEERTGEKTSFLFRSVEEENRQREEEEERRRQEQERKRIEEEKRREEEEEKKRKEEERLRLEEKRRKEEAEKLRLEEERKQKEKEEQLRIEKEKREEAESLRLEEERQKKEERLRKAEEERRQKEELRKKKEEEKQRQKEELRKKKEELKGKKEQKQAGQKDGSKKKIPVFIVAGVIVVLLLVFLLLSNAKVKVPNVTDIQVAKAEKILKEEGFQIKKTYQMVNGVEEGMVISQKEKFGSKIKKGSDIHLTVCSGTLVSVPNVVGQTLEEARIQLQNAKLLINQQDAYSDDVAEGMVISQEPTEGEVQSGTIVSLVVSKGQQPITIPDLAGKSADKAKEILKNAGLKVTIEKEYSAKVKKDSVISQSIKKGTEVEKGTSVKLVISKGKKPEKKEPSTAGSTPNYTPNSNTYHNNYNSKPSGGSSKPKTPKKDSSQGSDNLDDWELIN